MGGGRSITASVSISVCVSGIGTGRAEERVVFVAFVKVLAVVFSMSGCARRRLVFHRCIGVYIVFAIIEAKCLQRVKVGAFQGIPDCALQVRHVCSGDGVGF